MTKTSSEILPKSLILHKNFGFCQLAQILWRFSYENWSEFCAPSDMVPTIFDDDSEKLFVATKNNDVVLRVAMATRKMSLFYILIERVCATMNFSALDYSSFLKSIPNRQQDLNGQQGQGHH